jgi:trimethyllysine dioxygenase
MAADSGVGNWTDKIVCIFFRIHSLANYEQRRYGFCYVDGCPVSPEKTQQLLERIAFIRVTHYGAYIFPAENSRS